MSFSSQMRICSRTVVRKQNLSSAYVCEQQKKKILNVIRSCVKPVIVFRLSCNIPFRVFFLSNKATQYSKKRRKKAEDFLLSIVCIYVYVSLVFFSFSTNNQGFLKARPEILYLFFPLDDLCLRCREMNESHPVQLSTRKKENKQKIFVFTCNQVAYSDRDL